MKAKSNLDFGKSIEQLENDFWAAREFETGLVEKVHVYRKIPVHELSVEQIRLLIDQNQGLQFLIPKAMEVLKGNILAEGDMYEGDLLSAILSVKSSYWETHKDIKLDLTRLLTTKKQELEQHNENNSIKQLIKKVQHFCS